MDFLENSTAGSTMFLFRDGPVTTAVKNGGILILEDINLPSASVTERLNSLLETEPSFCLSEDISNSDNNIPVLLGQQQIIATANVDTPELTNFISPAARSRFTEIQVEKYKDEEVKSIINMKLKLAIESNQVREKVTSLLCSLTLDTATEIEKFKPSQKIVLCDYLRDMLRCVEFIANPVNADIPIFPDRVILGVRFFLLDNIDVPSRIEILKKSNMIQFPEKYYEVCRPPTIDHGAVVIDTRNNDLQNLETVYKIDSIFSSFIDNKITMHYCGLSAEYINPSPPCNDFVPTPTVILQMARLFSAVSARSPLLLQGPPGIGKFYLIELF
jgi:midasin